MNTKSILNLNPIQPSRHRLKPGLSFMKRILISILILVGLCWIELRIDVNLLNLSGHKPQLGSRRNSLLRISYKYFELKLFQGEFTEEEDSLGGVEEEEAGGKRLLISNSSADLNKFVWHHDLSSDAWNPDSNRRIIAIGDVHGMLGSLKKLLQTVSYHPQTDTVLLVGDLAAKHPSIKSSLKTIKYCRKSGFKAVRGNHDQYIIIWRNWMEHHRKDYVHQSELDRYQTDDQATLENDDWLKVDQPDLDLQSKFPPGLKWKTQHFEIARRLPKSDFHWMLSLSLTLYFHPLRTYFVHAGLLPWPSANDHPKSNQTDSILSIKENEDAYTLLEMRRVKKGRKPTKSKTKGKPWYKIWNKSMDSCRQTKTSGHDSFTVIYGHWASKGLKIKDWSIGLDSGCVYGREISGLVFGKDRTNDDHPHHITKSLKKYRVQIRGFNATVVQISCPTP